MEAQRLLIVLHDESAGYEATPDRVPLAVLRSFAKDVDDLLRGDGEDVDTPHMDVAIVQGSLGLRTAPTANPSLLADLRHLASGELLDGIDPKRRTVIERWQRAARRPHTFRVEIAADFLPRRIVVSSQSDFRADDADQWVGVERYVRGEIEDLGGHARPNAHIRLPDGKMLRVDAPREVLRDEKVNRLYKLAMVRIRAEYNVATREYRNAQLIQFVEHDSKIDERELARFLERGAKAWGDVPDAGAWIDDMRGGDD